MASSDSSLRKVKYKESQTSQEIIAGFQKLRREHRFLLNKLTELDLDLQEHRFVLSALKDLDDDSRRCFRLVGEVLYETTVKDVIIILKGNEENIGKLVESCSEKLKAKEDEIAKYKEDYNLTIRQAEEVFQCNESENGPKRNT